MALNDTCNDMCIICIVIINIYWLILISTRVGWKVWGGGRGGRGEGMGGGFICGGCGS